VAERLVRISNLLGALAIYTNREPTKDIYDLLTPLKEDLPPQFFQDPSDLSSHYVDVFIINIPPYESVFTESRMWGSAAFEVWRHYREWGYEPKLEGLVGPDHISLELAFFSLLLAELPRSRDAAVEFAEAHLLRWVPLLRATLEVNYPDSPYTLAVQMAERLLEEAYSLL
jgi:TorA maturation chaperone TorD